MEHRSLKNVPSTPSNRIQKAPFFLKNRNILTPNQFSLKKRTKQKQTNKQKIFFCISLAAHVYNTSIQVPLPLGIYGLGCYLRFGSTIYFSEVVSAEKYAHF